MSLFLTKLLPSLIGPAALAGAGAFVYGTRFESCDYRLETERLTLDGIATAVDGNGKQKNKLLRILHISDLHLCYPESRKIEFLQEVTSQPYDLLFLTGDIFENYSGLAYATSIMARSPRLGAFAVLGNHDYYNYTVFHKVLGRMFRKYRHPRNKRDVGPMIKGLEKGGFHVLRNQSVSLVDEGVHIVGIDYPSLSSSRLNELVSTVCSGQLSLGLFHVPINLQNMVHARLHLAFGGHTHGGQIRIPGLGAIITDSELPRWESSGLFRRGQTAFHISRGLGADPRSNIRLFCPPAATVVELSYR